MSMHTRAFSEMHFLIYGEDPLLPMKLEQTLANSRPSDEINFDSFESYEQAYDFAKDNKNVGLIFLLENCGDKSINSVFEQLSKMTEKQDTCFAVLLHNGEESFKGLRALKDNEKLIGYYDVNEMLDENKTAFILKDIWQKYQECYEKTLIPSVLAQTYRSLAVLHAKEETINFSSRLTTLISGEMNISWKESFILKWYPTLQIIKEHEGAVLSSNVKLQALFDSIFSGELSDKTLDTIASSEHDVAKKITAAVERITSSFIKSSTESLLSEELKQVTPRSKALTRILKKHELRINELSSQCQSKHNLSLLKVV